MKTGKKLALALGLAAGAVLAVVASKSSKKIKHQITKKASDNRTSNYDDSEVNYI